MASSSASRCLQDINILERLRKSLTINFSIPATSEDCLYLNIYVPDHAKEGSRLPVMVWIHGGHFLFGSASMYDGSLLSASQNIVVVTIQFRLGLLGFFSTEDKHTSGNWGYLDQVAAQRWIQENIGHFGGDPGLVAIFDESIGGINASSHVLSPMSKAFLYRTIKERDVTIQPGLISSRSESITRVIAHLSACEKYSSVSLVECLRNKTEREILAISKYFKIIPGEINGQFFPKHPEDPLASIKFHQGSSVINVNSNEYGSIIPVSLGITKFKEISRDNIRQILLNPFMVRLTKGIRPYDVDTMMYLYLWNFEDPKELQAQFQEMLGDLELPALRVARYQQSPSSPVYFYAFQQGAIPFGSIKSNYVEVDYGVELLFVFGAFLHGPAAYEQKLFSVNTIIFWANFVRNRPAVLADPKPNEDYPLLPVGQGLRAEKMKFWLKDLLQKKKRDVLEK